MTVAVLGYRRTAELLLRARLRVHGAQDGHPFYGNQYTEGAGSGSYYHGTAASVAERIRSEGLKPLGEHGEQGRPLAFVADTEHEALRFALSAVNVVPPGSDYTLLSPQSESHVALVEVDASAKEQLEDFAQYKASATLIAPNLIKSVRIFAVKDVIGYLEEGKSGLPAALKTLSKRHTLFVALVFKEAYSSRGAAAKTALPVHRVAVLSGQVHGATFKALGAPEGHPFYGNQWTEGTVTGADGQPLVLYHGSVSQDVTAETLRNDMPATRPRPGQLDGIYLTSDKAAAFQYTRPRGAKLGVKPGRIVRATAVMKNPIDITKAIKDGQKRGLSFGDAKREALKAVTPEHDGVIFRGDKANSDEFMVRSSAQLRSAASALPVHGVADAAVPTVKALVKDGLRSGDLSKLAPQLARVASLSAQLHARVFRPRMRAAGDLPGHEFHGNQYVFHGTPGANIDKIASEGLKPNAEGNPLNFAHFQHTAEYYAGKDGVLLRVRRVHLPADTVHDPVTSRSWTSTAVSPRHIERLEHGVWSPLVRTAEALRTLKSEPRRAQFVLDLNLANARAADWAQQYGAQLVTGIDDESRRAIQYLIARAEAGTLTRPQVKELLESFVGLTERQAVALDAYREALDEQGVEDADLEDELRDRYEDMLDTRADTIARTETMRASNEGQQILWDEAIDDGQLPVGALKEWITTPDDRLCPDCEAMDGKTVPVGDDFDEADGNPPLHPNCRCTIGISAQEAGPAEAREAEFNPDQPRDEMGRWTDGGVDGAVLRTAIIRRRGAKWVLYSHEGKVLGTHDTRDRAVKQEQAIEASRHRAASRPGLREALARVLRRLRAAGDVAGHEFHGNQYTGGGAAEPNYHKDGSWGYGSTLFRVRVQNDDNDPVHDLKIRAENTDQAIVYAFKHPEYGGLEVVDAVTKWEEEQL